MPCTSEGYDRTPSQLQYEIRRAAGFLAYVKGFLGMENQYEIVISQSEFPSEKNKEMIAELCGLIGGLEEKDFNDIVYDPRSKQSRRLADWWEEHQEKDRQREARERKAQRIAELRISGLSKLTDEEIAALKIEV